MGSLLSPNPKMAQSIISPPKKNPCRFPQQHPNCKILLQTLRVPGRSTLL